MYMGIPIYCYNPVIYNLLCRKDIIFFTKVPYKNIILILPPAWRILVTAAFCRLFTLIS